MSYFPDEYFDVIGDGKGRFHVHCPEHGLVVLKVCDITDAYQCGAQHMNSARHNVPVTAEDVPADLDDPLLGGM